MGDMREEFDALKEHHKNEREARAAVNIESLGKLGIPAYEQSKNVYRVDTTAGAVMYYPTSSKWQHRGRTMRGDTSAFHGWLKKQRLI